MNGDVVLDRNLTSAPVSGSQVKPQMGSLNKEQAPPVAFEPNLSEFIKPEAEPNVDQEQRDMGVVVTKEAPNLAPQDRQIGLRHSGATVPVPKGPTGLVQISQKGDISNSGTWLDELTEKVRKVMKLMGI
ncbi:MAG: hypothetical protein HYW62_04005 [Candidatus Levybacteria bacterium]|nr:hypothetical protein [Candidatus Levybacteria bacterium]